MYAVLKRAVGWLILTGTFLASSSVFLYIQHAGFVDLKMTDTAVQT